jgi:hypothetical protein
VARAAAFSRGIGKTVIEMEREVPGFVANRLQEALWREALHMVANGDATVDQIDAAITQGPGLRWPVHGPCLTFHLAGGEGGMAHMLDHFGPSLRAPWTHLEAPELTAELRDAMVEGTAAEADGRDYAALVAERDRAASRSAGPSSRRAGPPSGPDQRPVAEDGRGAVEVGPAVGARDPLLDGVDGEHAAAGDAPVLLLGQRDRGVLLALGPGLLPLGHVRHGARAGRRRPGRPIRQARSARGGRPSRSVANDPIPKARAFSMRPYATRSMLLVVSHARW